MNGMDNLVAGVDIGGTNTKIGIVGQEGEILAEDVMGTDKYPDFNDFTIQLSGTIRKLLVDIATDSSLKGIGLGAPNGNYYSGNIEFAPNLAWKGVVPLAGKLEQMFGIPVVLTNDANAAAMGEMMYGAARGMKDFIVITLGTGLGSGIVVHGEVVYGHDGFAGEMGHLTAVENGRLCGCGRKGCLETYVSATGICKTVLQLLDKYSGESELSRIPVENITSKMISEAASGGDRIAGQAFGFTGEILGKCLADVVALFSPEAIFLLGGLANAGDLIFPPTKAHMEKSLLAVFSGKVKILPSGLSENSAAILGAAGLILREISRKDPC